MNPRWPSSARADPLVMELANSRDPDSGVCEAQERLDVSKGTSGFSTITLLPGPG